VQVYVELVAFFTFVTDVLPFLVPFDEADLEDFEKETVWDGFAAACQFLQFFKCVQSFEKGQNSL